MASNMHDVFGYAIFCVVKLAGYVLAARFISSVYDKQTPNEWLIGLVRTAMGMGVGLILYGAIKLLPQALVGGVPFALLSLPVRICEWWLLIWFFYDRKLDQKGKGWLIVCFATIWSYLVDIPAMIGLFLTGGFGIC